MKRRTSKKGISLKKYTALAPKTLKASKAIGSTVVKKINYFLCSAAKTVRKTTKMIDRKTAKSIRSFTKRRSRK
jgi:hypothetical protein